MHMRKDLQHKSPESIVFILRDYTGDRGTPGRLIVPGEFDCFTIELPWRNNLPNKSCLPPGEDYGLMWTISRRFQRYMYLIVENIPERDGFRLHSGNVAGDVEKGFKSHSLGCPLLGKKRGVLWDQEAVLVSRPTVRAFEEIMNGREARLIIREDCHGV